MALPNPQRLCESDNVAQLPVVVVATEQGGLGDGVVLATMRSLLSMEVILLFVEAGRSTS